MPNGTANMTYYFIVLIFLPLILCKLKSCAYKENSNIIEEGRYEVEVSLKGIHMFLSPSIQSILSNNFH
jgi:hypothetical protein